MINVHEQKSLGMVRMSGTFPAEKCLGILKNHLAEFGLDVETSIFCAVTDGASVMKKMGRFSALEHQICYAHALLVTVCDVLYSLITVPDMEEENTDFSDNGDENIYNHDFDINLVDVKIPSLVCELECVIKKVCSLINLFRKSPIKNEVLQKSVKLEHRKELTLIRDCKTR